MWKNTSLVVEPTHLKNMLLHNMLVKLDHETPRDRVKIPKIFETATIKIKR